ncbi:MAG: hypothetical protein B7Z55_00690 [Planctomycetales bacterium 12-60-4]|nr:MAG: hypothetical protein B7Z55_00690 [Planctomycetales bacterium 12-60-4]
MPANPYAAHPVETWLARLQSSAGLEERYRAFVAVTELLEPEQAFEVVRQTLADRDGDLRAAAANWIALGVQRQRLALDDSATAALTTALSARLDDDDPDVQLAAARGLGWLAPQSPELSAAIVRLVERDDSHPTSQVALAELCGRVSSAAEPCLPWLRRWLSAEQADVREAAAVALARLGTTAAAAMPELVTALEDDEPFVRESAAVALGQLRPLPTEAVEALRIAAADEDEIVARAAQVSLAETPST